MLIITADDYGKNKKATSNIVHCYENKRITSASAMVFMEDSGRAASLAQNTDLEVGLHLNYTEDFSPSITPKKILKNQIIVGSYLKRYKISQIIYNPLLNKSFKILFFAQIKEFIRLYGKLPSFYNGHHHMHLCPNILINNLIPFGSRVRRAFTFDYGQKSFIKLFIRDLINFYISKKYITTNQFYNIVDILKKQRISKILLSAYDENIEIEVHPENDNEADYLLSNYFKESIKSITLGCFHQL